MAKNKQGGLNPPDSEATDRAKKADLITLPTKVEGTNCSNCKFVKILDKEEKIGFCTHPQVLQGVTNRMCCALWDAVGSIRPWKK